MPRSSKSDKRPPRQAAPESPATGEGVDTPEEPIAMVIVEGNTTISADQIAKHIKTRAGRPASARQIRDDVKALHATKWFFQIEPIFRETEDGLVLCYKVIERPVLQKIEYRGNKKLKTKNLEALTGLKIGGAFDVATNKEAARRLEAHYHEKSYVYAQVSLEKGGFKDDREVIFLISEGPKVHVSSINFIGNKAFHSSLIAKNLKTKKRWIPFIPIGGKYDPATIPEDITAIKEYYHSLGYFDLRVSHKVKTSKDREKIEIEYTLEEGDRYKVRNIEVVGNNVIPASNILKDSKVKAGDFFSERKLNLDKEKVTNQYGELGRIFASINVEPRYLEEPGVIDLVYKIDEDEPYRIRRINVHINGEHPHTKESAVLTRMLVKPGDLANQALIKKSEKRVAGTQIFAGAQPGSADGPRIAVVKGEIQAPRAPRGEQIVRAQGYQESGPPTNPLFENNPEFNPLDDALRGPPPNFVDLDVNVSEGQTGRLMFGVGVNSNAGLVGSAVLDESNFDITRIPTSLQEIVDGTAFRGGGQQFRLEAVPGVQLSRYAISWRDPYFMDQDFSVGTSGSYYTRIFPDWYERRAGGRVQIGKQFTPYLSSSVALRAEEVNISNPTVPTPPSLEEVLGNNFLSTVTFAVTHDTRDTAFLAGNGHYISASYEQAFGNFNFPRVELDARQYFTLRERPDGSGRQIVTLSGTLGYTGDNTPIFEKFYAGGFQSFRGFAFRGVTPRVGTVGVGGNWEALGSTEYMLPITASDAIQFVTFSDFGTVQNNVSLSEFRLSVGVGARLTIPAMGPTPIALDLGFPVLKQDGDHEQIFSFYVGALR